MLTLGDLYARLLRRSTPETPEIDVYYPSDLFDAAGTAAVATPPAIDWSRYSGVAWTGCSLCINSNDARVRHQLDLATAAFAAGVPQFGSCWAIQIAAVAAGGSCAPAARGREMGIGRKLALTPAGRAHPMFAGKPPVFEAYESHEDEVTVLPPGAVLLAGNGWSAVQAAAIPHLNGEFWAVQYHPEYDLKELAMLVNARKSKLTKMGFFPDEAAAGEYVADLMRVYHAADSTAPAVVAAAALDAAETGAALGAPADAAAVPQASASACASASAGVSAPAPAPTGGSVKHLLWRYGLDSDVLSEATRTTEVRNWVRSLVLPRYAETKARAAQAAASGAARETLRRGAV
jgi:GMP synthase (glutamine-hydrolysing)